MAFDLKNLLAKKKASAPAPKKPVKKDTPVPPPSAGLPPALKEIIEKRRAERLAKLAEKKAAKEQPKKNGDAPADAPKPEPTA